MEIIISKVRTSKPRTQKQLLNDQRLKEKFIDYHQQMKQIKYEEPVEPEEKEDIFELLRDIGENQKEIEILLKKDEPVEEVIKKKRGRPRLQPKINN
jgi:hypothetical protein